MPDSSYIKQVANIVSGPLLSISVKTNTPISELVSEQNILTIAKLFSQEELNNQGVQKLLEFLAQNPDKNLEAQEVAKNNGWLQVQDTSVLEKIVDEVLSTESFKAQIEQYKNGKTQLFGFFIGKCMENSKGSGNPKLFSEILVNKLEKINL